MSVEDRDFDRRLEQLFDSKQESLAGDVFQAEIERRLRNLRRAALLRRMVVCVLLAAGLAVSTPLVVHESLQFSGYVSAAVPKLGKALMTPVGWVASVVIVLWALSRGRLFRR